MWWLILGALGLLALSKAKETHEQVGEYRAGLSPEERSRLIREQVEAGQAPGRSISMLARPASCPAGSHPIFRGGAFAGCSPVPDSAIGRGEPVVQTHWTDGQLMPPIRGGVVIPIGMPEPKYPLAPVAKGCPPGTELVPIRTITPEGEVVSSGELACMPVAY